MISECTYSKQNEDLALKTCFYKCGCYYAVIKLEGVIKKKLNQYVYFFPSQLFTWIYDIVITINNMD